MERLSSVRAAFDDLKGQLTAWEERSILQAPADGRVSYVKFWGDNQPVNTGDEIFVTVPDLHELTGIVHLPQSESGKVEVGQQVRVKFDKFPKLAVRRATSNIALRQCLLTTSPPQISLVETPS